MKKFLALALAFVMVAAVSIAGTIAYFTDDQNQINVMTVGNVQVKLQEKQRTEDGSALEPFEQGKELSPLVGSAQTKDRDQWGQPTLNNYVDKIVYATNTGESDAYIRFLVAIPCALIPDPTDSTDNPLHWNYGNRVDITGEGKYNDVAYADSDWAKLFTYADIEVDGKAAEVTINGVEHWVTYFTMQEALAPGADSLAVMSGVYLDNRVDYDADLGVYTFNGEAIGYDFSNGVQIPVVLQAVQTDGWDSIDQAFEEAYGKLTVANAEAWFSGAEAVVGDNDGTAMAGRDTNVVGVQAAAGTYSNLTIVDDTTDYVDGGKYFRALYGSVDGDVVIKDSYLQGTYAMNVTTQAEDVTLTAVNTTFDGWVSYSGFESATFNGCTFIGDAIHSDYNEEDWTYGSQCRVAAYDNTTLINCEFGENFCIGDRKDGVTFALVNCYKNGVKVTAENFNELLNNPELNGVYTMYAGNDVTITVDGVEVVLPEA